MTTEVLTVEANWSLEELKSFLVDHNISGAPVTEGKKLVGVVSATDLLQSAAVRSPGDHPAYFSMGLERRLAESELRTMHVEGGETEQTVRDVMTPVVFHVAEDSTVAEVADMMTRGRIHRVLVKQGDRLCGIVSALDLVGLLRDETSPN
jgi:CBS domain-containing protein